MIDDPPFISRHAIRAVLEGVLYGAALDNESPLGNLLLVDAYLSENHVPHAEHQRLFALQQILSETIAEALSTHRVNIKLPTINPTETLEQAITIIQHEAQQNSPELTGWSWLYYRYVRVDLNMTPRRYAEMAFLDERTLRRHQHNALGRLRDLLMKQEALVCTKQRQLRLYRALPYGVSQFGLERDALLQETRQLLANNPPRHLLVTGPRGIGKTLFVHMLASEHITQDELDHVVWVDEPQTVDHVRQQIHHELIADLSLDVSDYLLAHRVVIVLDNIGQLGADLELMLLLRTELANAIVYVINTIYVPLSADCKHIVLPELSKNAVTILVQQSRMAFIEQQQLHDFVDNLWQQVGGNPLAVKLLINNLNNINLEYPLAANTDVLQHIFTQAFYTLSLDARHAAVMFAMCSPSTITLDQMKAAWPASAIHDGALAELISCGLLSPADHQTYHLTQLTRNVIMEMCSPTTAIGPIVDALITELDQQVQFDLASCFAVVEHILFRGWPALSPPMLLNWIMQAVILGLNAGHFSLWAAILGRATALFTEVPFTLLLSEVVCLRKLAEWADAERLARAVIAQSGESGEFVWQGKGLLEIGLIYRQQGLYEQALEALQRARGIAERSQDQELRCAINLEMAQIAFEEGDFRQAMIFLQEAEQEDIKSLILMCELNIALGNYFEARARVNLISSLYGDDPQLIVRLNLLQGKIFAAQGNWNAAEKYLSVGIAASEHLMDRVATARAKSNLAAVLLHARRDYDDARQLLIQARQIQQAIQDRQGLLYTERNLAELDRRYAIDGAR